MVNYYAYREKDRKWLLPDFKFVGASANGIGANVKLDEIKWVDKPSISLPLHQLQAAITLFASEEEMVLVPVVLINDNVSLDELLLKTVSLTAEYTDAEFNWVKQHLHVDPHDAPTLTLERKTTHPVHGKTIDFIFYRDGQGWFVGASPLGKTPVDAVFLNNDLAKKVRALIAEEKP